MKLSWEHGGGNYIEHYTAELPKNAQETLLPASGLFTQSVCLLVHPPSRQPSFQLFPGEMQAHQGLVGHHPPQLMGKPGKETKALATS